MAYTTIKKPSDYFNTVLYTGNGSYGNSITGVGFQPDLVWIKKRNSTADHQLTDAVRGTDKAIESNTTDAERTGVNLLHSFDSDGFTVDDDASFNGNNDTFASWNWLGANGTASNTDGSITSTVSANTTSGFSIISYTGNGTAGATVGHGLGVAPKMIIFKSRSNGTKNWITYHESIGNTKALFLNLTNAEATGSDYWNNTSPTSSVFTLGDNTNHNESSGNMIAYCFAEVKGFSKFGSYVGNGTSGVDGAGDGTFVYTGFKPGMIIIKPSSAVENWQILDNKRPGFNESDNLAPNNNAAENTSNDFVDLVSNGFKLRSGSYSASGVTYIYMAFAEEPLVGDNPATAR